MSVTQLQSNMSEAEWQTRVDLAALYQLEGGSVLKIAPQSVAQSGGYLRGTGGVEGAELVD